MVGAMRAEARDERRAVMDLIWIIIIVLVVLALLGYFGYSRRGRGL
jgi:flagellar basal body-associated protein FliL